MIRLLDGPAEGSYAVKSAPTWLRAVVTGEGNDVLDQPADTPEPRERVYVYRLVNGTRGHVHLNFGSGARGRGRTGFYALGDYLYQPEVDGEALRDRVAWIRWVGAQPPGATETEPGGR